jgi:5-methylcytosine-specific restriction endonuclease McrBC regulatory subunit McrC
VFIASFLDSALARARQGLLSRYVPIEAETVVLKGRFDGTAQMRQRIDRSHFLRCVYDDFTADNEFNQAIRASLNVCRSWINWCQIADVLFDPGLANTSRLVGEKLAISYKGNFPNYPHS